MVISNNTEGSSGADYEDDPNSGEGAVERVPAS